MKILKQKNHKGFTLVEALVSMTVVLIAIIGPLSLIMNAININKQERDRVAAAFLAEEPIENLRAYRDSFALACQTIDYEGGYCTNKTSVKIDNAILMDTDNPRTIAWRVFVDTLQRATLLSSNPLYFDNNSFFINSLVAPISYPACSILKLDSNYSYNCVTGNNTSFKRTTKLTLVSPQMIRVEVEVIYAKSRYSTIKEKSIKVVDYIYER